MLFNRAHRFRCAHGINNALTDLYAHLAAGVISPSRASTLAYISSLILRTLPAIEKEPSFACCRPIHPRNPPGPTGEQIDEQSETQTAVVSSPAEPIAAKDPWADPDSLPFPYRTRRWAPPADPADNSSVTPPPAPLAPPTIPASAIASVELHQLMAPARNAPSEPSPAAEAAVVNADCTVLFPPPVSGGAEFQTAKSSRVPFISMAKPALRYLRYGRYEIDPPGSSNPSGPEDNRANSS